MNLIVHAAFFRSLRRNCLIQQLRLWGNLRDATLFSYWQKGKRPLIRSNG